MAERELLAVPQTFSGRIDIASGVARMSATLWATLWRGNTERSDTVAVIVHPTSNFMGHYALEDLARRGVDAVGMATRYLGNDSTLIVENCVLDIGAVIGHLKRELGYRRVLLIGNSGGGSLVALYQSQAEHPTITATPAGDPIDLAGADLTPADGLSLTMAHPGRALVYTDCLDPAITDENEPFQRDPGLDMFRTENGPPYGEDFVATYRAAQLARNRSITETVRTRLKMLEADPGGPDDMPFVVHGTAADLRFLDLTIEPSDRRVQTIVGEPRKANFLPARLGHYSSLRSWLSQFSIDDSRSNAIAELPNVSVPVQVIYGTADNAAFPSHAHAMYRAIGHDRKELISLQGADHYFRDRPDLRSQMCDDVARWALSL